MKLGFSVLHEALRAAAEQASAAGEVVRAVQLSAVASTVADGLPGGWSELSANRLAVVWGTVVSRWADDIDRHSEALVASADTYQAAEDATTQTFTAGLG
ncbi:MAG: hypothetical protein ACRDT0_02260 [Pseudonocardiaceae bacterium]